MNLEEIKQQLNSSPKLSPSVERDILWLVTEVEQSYLEIIKLRNKLHALEERAEKTEFELEQALRRERKREKRIW